MIKFYILLFLIICIVRGDNLSQNYARLINNNLASSSISGYSFKDNPARFLGSRYVTNINNLPQQGNTKIKPFSGDYWAWRYGGPSARYNVMDTRWKPFPVSIKMYSQPSEHNTYKNDADYSQRVNKYYSAVEKYDLLVGDESFTLTRTVKNYGFKLGGGRDFATWMGLCHGLAPASYMFPEPIKPVELTAANKKTNIKFFVDDIKALGTLFWAFAKFPSRVVGRRNGPIHPASFFIIITNYIGLQSKNMNFEPFADNEIWNYALSGYSYSLYNVVSGSTGSFSQSSVSVDAARTGGSSLARQAAANARSGSALIVGVKMTMNYIGDVTARPNPMPRKESSTSYNCVLILRANGSIIDGFWASARKPSYVWGPAKDVNGPYDKFVPRIFNGSADELKKFTYYSRLSSRVLNYLFRSAK
jgi:hypothetical protein